MGERFKYYFEDFDVGRVVDVGRRTLSEEEIIAFARDFDPQPFHVDHEAAARSPYAGIIASGWHTCALAMRMMCDAYLLDAASLGSPGVDNVRWHKPVRPGDELRLAMHVLEANRSRSKPDRGFVRSRWEMSNQNGEIVMTMEGVGIFRVRGEA